MALRIEDYALIGDTQTAALVGKGGSIDWFCAPRFDSGACFAALLGDASHGRWLLAPRSQLGKVTRRYEPRTLVLITEHTTPEGVVEVRDCMPPREKTPDIVRTVTGVRGRVTMQMELVIRFAYGSVVPWVVQREGSLRAIGGPDALFLCTPVKTRGQHLTTVATFEVAEGQVVPFRLGWYPSHEEPPPQIDAVAAVADTVAWWREWMKHCVYKGEWSDQVLRSLVTLKALTYAPTGGIVAAPTMGLPELIGGERNWDYRFCWLRDATFTLYALMSAGFTREAEAWRDWLVRAIAGDPSQLQIMYGPAGERHLWELEIPWLPGYEASKPVRIGNGAVHQLQLDVYGEILDTLYQSRRNGIGTDGRTWAIERAIVHFLETGWQKPDSGIWEVRGPNRHFTHSKMMVWVALDRAIKSIEQFGHGGPLDQWRALRDAIRREILQKGYDASRKTFTQYYGSKQLDASLLLIPQVGFLAPHDERFRGTVAAIERELTWEGLVMRYSPDTSANVDGLPPGEGAFLACTFWLADCYALMGRFDDAKRLFSRMIALTNDVGLLSEEYDPIEKRMLGNFPQAFSHVGLINTAYNLCQENKPAEQRAKRP
ncbi:MAG TPA: glycoside hydrolase family 15 protein [Polyangiaceae bacterium]|nr:glycoside hydrolase family 15 protein [Polyangiaceae bacterium]